MKKLILFIIYLSILASCDLNLWDNNDVHKKNGYLLAEVVKYYFDCSSCILYFPDDTAEASEILGNSPANYYHAVNMDDTDFKIGKFLYVKARPAEENELRVCTAMGPVYDYKNIYVTEYKEYNECTNSPFIDTVELTTGECITTFGQATLCFDSVLHDSRCPEGAQCVWMGNAGIKLTLDAPGYGQHEIILNTYPGGYPEYPTDTSIYNLNISLIKLDPYPYVNQTIGQNDYVATIVIVNRVMLKSNARVFEFHPEKEMCTWGWTIKMDEDTIRSNTPFIGNAVGYGIDFPVDVYLELGDLDPGCLSCPGYKYYEVKRIIVVD